METHTCKRYKHTHCLFCRGQVHFLCSGVRFSVSLGERREHTQSPLHSTHTLSGMPRPAWPCRSSRSQTFPNRHDIPTSHHQRLCLLIDVGMWLESVMGSIWWKHTCARIASLWLIGSSMGTLNFALD